VTAVRQREPKVKPSEAVGPEFDDSYPELFQVAYRVAYRLLGDRGEAEDVAQDTMARACVQWSVVRRRETAASWVATTSGNLSRNHWRARTRDEGRQRLVGRRPQHALSQDDLTIDRLRVHETLAGLPPRQREVLVLRFLADLSEEVVAAALGCSVGTVKQHAARGLARLRPSTTRPGSEEENDDAGSPE